MSYFWGEEALRREEVVGWSIGESSTHPLAAEQSGSVQVIRFRIGCHGLRCPITKKSEKKDI